MGRKKWSGYFLHNFNYFPTFFLLNFAVSVYYKQCQCLLSSPERRIKPISLSFCTPSSFVRPLCIEIITHILITRKKNQAHSLSFCTPSSFVRPLYIEIITPPLGQAVLRNISAWLLVYIVCF